MKIVPAAESGVTPNGANIVRMDDLVQALHGTTAARFFAAPSTALGAEMYHANLSDCIKRFRWESVRVVVTPEVFWVTFAIELAARVHANVAGLSVFRIPEPLDIGMVPHPGGTLWPSDTLSRDVGLFPKGIPFSLNTFQQAIMVEGSKAGDFSHHAASAAVAAHMGLAKPFRVGGETPFWMPNIHRLGPGDVAPPGPFPAIEAASVTGSWSSVERAIRLLGDIARESSDDGRVLSVWIGAVADLARDMASTCADAPKGADGSVPAQDRLAFRLSMLLAPSTGHSQASTRRFRHRDLDMSVHYGVFWSGAGAAEDTVRPELGWVLSLCPKEV